MGRNFKKNKQKNWSKNKGKDTYVDKKSGDYERFETDNLYYKNYYKHVIASDFANEDEFNQFYDILKVTLPTTFRVNSSYPNYQAFLSMQNNDKYMHDEFFSQKIEDDQKDKEGLAESDDFNLSVVDWYPEAQIYELNASRMVLKKSPGLKKQQRWLARAGEAGLLTRQELVSMIPPLCLEPTKDDVIFDMCAAPGSKTSQILEMVNHDHAKNADKELDERSNSVAFMKGAVVCNDVDAKRAFLLTHQVKRINTSNMMVTNHAGQLFPALYNYTPKEDNPEHQTKTRVYFDKVQVDVPCSGDGAIRKLPQKWKKWDTHAGMSLHNLQITLLIRAINMTKVGGTIVYSTCSLNPIENEAVLTEVMRKSENLCESGTLELIDVHEKLQGFKGRRGLHAWPVMTNKHNEKTNYELIKDDQEYTAKDQFNIYLPEQKNSEEVLTNLKLKDSMFPDELAKMKDVYKTHHSMRVMPHDQNTGGFFIGIIKKNKDTTKLTDNHSSNVEQENLNEIILNNDSADEKIMESEKVMEDEKIMEEQKSQIPEEMTQENKDKNEPKKKNNNKKTWISFCQEMPEDWAAIKEYYGLENFPSERLFIQNKGDKIVSFVSKAIADIINNDRNGKVNTLYIGIKMFERTNLSSRYKTLESQQAVCYRTLQSGIDTIYPFMTKRKISVTLNELQYLSYNQNIAFKNLDQSKPNIHKIMETIEMGSFTISCEVSPGLHEFLTAQKMAASIVIMASKEHIDGLKVKYEMQVNDLYNNL